jgi:rhodanese-related sulfurtransferase
MFMLSLLLAATITTKADVPRVTAAELHALIDKGEAVAVDVRGTVPYELGHITGAVWLPLGLVNQRAGELPQDKLIVTYCTCKAEETSLEGAMLLSQHGFRVAVLNGGYPAWKDAGLPTQSSPVLRSSTAESASAPAGRLAAPASVPCDRDHLTSYAGTVKKYQRRGDEVTVVIDTTHDTTETVVSSSFLMEGKPFKKADWKRLRSGVSVVAWVCSDGPAILDWKPGAVTAAE